MRSVPWNNNPSFEEEETYSRIKGETKGAKKTLSDFENLFPTYEYNKSSSPDKSPQY